MAYTSDIRFQHSLSFVEAEGEVVEVPILWVAVLSFLGVVASLAALWAVLVAMAVEVDHPFPSVVHRAEVHPLVAEVRPLEEAFLEEEDQMEEDPGALAALVVVVA